MKISYLPKYHPVYGTVYRQTFRLTQEENQNLFQGQFSVGPNYGDSTTGSYIASKIYNLPAYKEQLKRIIIANSVVIVDSVIDVED